MLMEAHPRGGQQEINGGQSRKNFDENGDDKVRVFYVIFTRNQAFDKECNDDRGQKQKSDCRRTECGRQAGAAECDLQLLPECERDDAEQSDDRTRDQRKHKCRQREIREEKLQDCQDRRNGNKRAEIGKFEFDR